MNQNYPNPDLLSPRAENSSCLLSVLIPVCNEEENVEPLSKKITQVLSESDTPFELIYVDDGSTDNTVRNIRAAHDLDPRIKIVKLTRNFGSHIALSAGLKFVKGDCVVYLGGDFQEPPTDLPRFVEKWRAGFDIVWGKSTSRDDPIHRILLADLFYKIFRSISQSSFFGSNYVLIDRKVVSVINRFTEQNRSIGPLVDWTGLPATSIAYKRQARRSGKSKFNLRRQISVALDIITAYSLIPLRLMALTGLLISAMAFLWGMAIMVSHFLFDTGVEGWLSLMISMLFLGGVQMIMLGMLGEYIGRISDEVKGRPLYLIAEIIGLEESSKTLP